MAEIVRAGVQAVDPGQDEAAAALGMSRGATMRRIVLPQAMRVIIPPTGNETIAMLKDTSLLIAVPVTTELYFQLHAIGARTFQIIPMAVATILWYLALSSVLMLGQYFLEKRFSRGFGAARDADAARSPPRARSGGYALSAHVATAGVARDGTGPADGPRRGRTQVVRPHRGAQGHRPGGRAAARSCASSAPPVRASRRSCVHQPPGEDQRRPAVGRRRRWSATARRATSCTSSATRRWPRSAATSAWCSSGSTCSRT